MNICIFNILCDEIGYAHIKYVCLVLKYDGCLVWLRCELTWWPFSWNTSLHTCQLWFDEVWLTDKQWLLGHWYLMTFSWKWTSRPLNSRGKKLCFSVFVANNKIGTIREKLEFWKTHICHHELNSFSGLRDFPDVTGDDILKWKF